MSPLYRTLASLVLIAGSAVACSDSSTEPEDENESVPVVATLDRSLVGDYDTDEYSTICLTVPEDPPTISNTCPVLQWDGYSYWVLSFGDNRSSFAFHVYDEVGTQAGVEERTGARYLYAINVDETAEIVTFVGQAEREVTLTFDELLGMR